MQTAAQTTIQTGTTQSTATQELQKGREVIEKIGIYLCYGLIALLCIGIIIGIIKNTLKYIYSFYNTRRMTFIKVLLPKSDGKTDREQEKEIAKDMKEKV